MSKWGGVLLIPDLREWESRERGTKAEVSPPYRGRVTAVPAATRVLRRPALGGLAATLVFALSAFLGVSTAEPAQASPELASANCAGADDPRASAVVQRKAIVCLVNAARRQAGLTLLSTPAALRRAAAIKGRRVVSCGQLSHTPCGSDPTAAIRAAGYHYGWFGENLWLGTWGHFSARQVVESWLGSPGHRENILRPSFRHLGAARVRAQGIFGEDRTAVWVATFASPR